VHININWYICLILKLFMFMFIKTILRNKEAANYRTKKIIGDKFLELKKN